MQNEKGDDDDDLTIVFDGSSSTSTSKKDDDDQEVKRRRISAEDEDSNLSVIKTVPGKKSSSSSRTILVLQTVFQYLDGTELKKCRFVTGQWSALAACELLTRSKLQIGFQYSEKDGQHLSLSKAKKRTPKEEEDDTLNQFVESYESSKRLLLSPFPWVNFNFQDCHLTSQDMLNFLSVYGRIMKGLTLTLEFYGPDCLPKTKATVEHLRKLLVVDAPNLEFLSLAALRSSSSDHDKKFDLFPFPPSPSHQGRDEVRVKLPKLKTLHVNSSLPSSIISDLKGAAENLENFLLDGQ